MKTPKLTEHKVKQAIRVHGVQYTFTRADMDEFDQPKLDLDGNQVFLPYKEVPGIYHETGQGFTLVVGEAGAVPSKPTPSILTMLEDSEGIQIRDRVAVPPGSDLIYSVVSINDIGNLGLFADIALEVIVNELPL